MFLLDTDILIYALNGEPIVIENIRQHAAAPKAVSVITYGELIFGAQRSARITENLAKVHRIKEIFPLIEITPSIMETFGAMKADLQKNGTPVDDFDLLIGATAITMGYGVVTNNEKHFKKIPGLAIANWAKTSRKTVE
jgi:tRNA(fMet)-specific endonuclease VapC